MDSLIETPIRCRTRIDAPPERVFETLTSADGWNSWFTSEMTLDLRSGGEIRFVWRNWGPDGVDAEDSGVIITVEAPHRFVFTWHENNFAQPTTVSFELEERSGGTVLTLEDRGYPDSPDGQRWFMDCATGWGEAVTLLKVYLEHGIDMRRA